MTQTTARSVGELAAETGLTEKAIRLYADRGLLRPHREERTGARSFDEDQVRNARLIALYRSLDLSLADIARLLDAAEPVPLFDELWTSRRVEQRTSLAAAEYVRGVLARESPALRPVSVRDVGERLVLTVRGRATLPEIPGRLGELTARMFDLLGRAGEPPSDHLYATFHERATDGFPAALTLAAPVAVPVRPEAGFALEVDEAHREAFIAVTQEEATAQPFVVAVHDHLSTGKLDPGASVCGPNREIYFPTFGHGRGDEVVMEVAVPVG